MNCEFPARTRKKERNSFYSRIFFLCGYPPRKYIGNEEKLWYFNRKPKVHFALKGTSIWMRDT